MTGQPKLFSLIDKAIHDYDMLPKGSRVLIGASGGKDSTLLVEYFAHRLRRFAHGNADFSVTALYIQSDFAPPFNPELKALFASWNIELVELPVDVLERLKPGKKMSCWWCSTQRRTELIRYAMAHGYDTLALGHHLDDILETLLMNMLVKSELSTMPPVLAYDKYPLRIVRPLCLLPVSRIVEHASEEDWQSVTCTCTYQDNSGRKAARARLAALTDGDEAKKRHLYNALSNIKQQYLPVPVQPV